MTDYRAIFAVLSLAVGVILLIIAARYSFAKQTVSAIRRKRVLTSLTYGVLFLIAGGVLWTRQGEEQVVAPSAPQVTETKIPSPVSQPTTQQEPQSAAPVKTDTLARSETIQRQSETVRDISAAVPDKHVASDYSADVVRPTQSSQGEVVVLPEENKPASKAISATPPEDRIALAVNHAFLAIENFFAKYAAPVPVKAERLVRRTAKPTSIRFPRVTFDEQTANLSPESEAALRLLATDLNNQPDMNLEIQARVDSVGPEAFNYMLTQARAAAVRDFLVLQGIPSERLIARGFGTQPFPQGTNNLIAFVVRR